jgi:hypothetical protein
MSLTPYEPTLWVDDVTDLDEITMNHIEGGILQADERARNALAGLLPPVQNGKWIKGVGGAAVWSDIQQADVQGLTAALAAKADASTAATKPNYGTTLPAGPVDGQEAILVDSLTNPTYQWRFRYNAGSALAYKWEFIGGTALRLVYAPNAQAMNAAGFSSVAMTGGQFAGTTFWWSSGVTSWVVTRAGVYSVRARQHQASTSPQNLVLAAFKYGGGVLSQLDVAASSGMVTLAAGNHAVSAADGAGAGAAVGEHIGAAWTALTVIANGLIYETSIEITPVRVA